MKSERIRRILARTIVVIDAELGGNARLTAELSEGLRRMRERLQEMHDAMARTSEDVLIEGVVEEMELFARKLEGEAPGGAELLALADQIGDMAHGAVMRMSMAPPELPESFGIEFEPEPEPEANYSIVKVFYATDRDEARDGDGKLVYGAGRAKGGSLHYGECEISIPKVHKVGRLEAPSIWRLEFRPDPNKHVVLLKTLSHEENAYFDLVKAAVERSEEKEAFVFIHGYNVSFENAARRAGQLAFDLEFVGAPIFYSWPSNGKVADYPKDEADVAWSAPHFERFLTLLAARSGALRIHVIAHSMGNRAACEAMKAISMKLDTKVKLHQVILAAPDIDADTFAELAAELKQVSKRVTLYASSNDLALKASKALHGNPRAGEAGDSLLILPTVDTIDASAISTDFLAHSYFGDRWPLLADIQKLMAENRPPNKRFGLVEVVKAAGTYYRFKAD